MKPHEITERKASYLEQVKNYAFGGNLNISYKNLTSLEGCPKEVSGYFGCSSNDLTSLKGGPEKVADYFSAIGNQLTSFEHFPKYIGGFLYISQNNFESFKDIDQHIEFIGSKIFAYTMNITSGYSDLFGINGLKAILIDRNTDCDEMNSLAYTEIQTIVNKYLPTKNIIEFQDEMIKSGYESYL